MHEFFAVISFNFEIMVYTKNNLIIRISRKVQSFCRAAEVSIRFYRVTAIRE